MINSKKLLAEALSCAERGIPVFPFKNDKTGPHTLNGYKDATTDCVQIKQWWATYPDAMLAFPTGEVSGFFVLDIDTHHENADGFASLQVLEAEHGTLPDTYQIDTPSGGRHLYFNYPDNRIIKNSTSRIGKGLDIRGNGGLIIAAPSVRADGKAYRVYSDADIADAPEWLLELVETKNFTTPTGDFTFFDGAEHAVNYPEAYKKSILEGELKELSEATIGTRNSTLFKVAANLYNYVAGGTFEEYEVYSALISACETNKLMEDKNEVETTINNAKERGLQTPRKITKKEEKLFMVEPFEIETTEKNEIMYPLGYTCNATGLWKTEKTKSGDYEQIRIGDPITFLGIGCAEDSNGWGSLLEWKSPDGLTRQYLLLFSALHEGKNEWAKHLADRGYNIIPKYRKLIENYLSEMATIHREKILSFPRRIGWLGSSYVLPSRVIGNADAFPQINLNECDLYSSRGTKEEWVRASRYCIGNIHFEFALASAFAGSLMRLANIETGSTFHFLGASSSGKSTCQRIACSVWGGRDHSVSWNTTDNGLEGIAVRSNDNLLVLDDISQANEKVIGKTSYMIANGQGKSRANRNGDTKPTKKWRTIALSSGEESLENKMFGVEEIKGGQCVRFLDIPVERDMLATLHGFASAEDIVKTIDSLTGKNYGFAGEQFLEYVVENYENLSASLPDEVKALAKKLRPADADTQVERVSQYFALVQCAGELAQEAGALPKEMDIAACVEKFVSLWLERRGTSGNMEETKIVSRVKMFLLKFGHSSFSRVGEECRSNTRYGYIRRGKDGKDKYMIDEALFLKEIAKSDNKKLVYSALKNAGLLAGEGGKPTATFRFPENDNRNTRCVALRMPNEELLEEPVEEVVKVPASRFIFETSPEEDIFQGLAHAI